MNKENEIAKNISQYITSYTDILNEYAAKRTPHFVRNLNMMKNNIEIYFSDSEIEKGELFESLNYEWKQCFQGRSSISVFEIATDDFKLNQTLNSRLDELKNAITALLAMQKDYCSFEK